MQFESSTDQPSDKTISSYLSRPVVALLILAAVTFTIYLGTLTFGFVWDDSPQIVNNPLIRSWSNIGRVFTNDLWFLKSGDRVYYRPMFIVWSILNYSVFGLRAWGWHLVAVLLHVVAGLSVYLLARRMQMDHWASLIAAATFAFHPVHIECATWVSASSDTMVTIFFVLAFVAFLNGRDPGRPNWARWRFLSFVLLACGLLTKEMAVTFPVMVVLYVWFSFSKGSTTSFARQASRSIVAALPYGALVAGYLIIRKLALHREVGSFDPNHGAIDMFLTLPGVLFQYLRNLLLPFGTTGLYYTPYATAPWLRSVVVPALVLVGVALLVIYWARRTGDLAVAFFSCWILITLAPVLYLPAFGEGDFVRDRYIYLPSIGFVILVAKALRLLPGLGQITRQAVQAVTVVVLCTCMAAGTVKQQVYWGSNLLIFSRGHELYPENVYASIGLASALGHYGDYQRALELLEPALPRVNGETRYETLMLLAEIYARIGRIQEGQRTLAAALQMSSDLNTGISGKVALAGLLVRLDMYDDALAVCKQVLQQEPDLYSAMYNCGNANFKVGNYIEAERLLSETVRETPDQAAPNYFLGRALFALQRYPEAETSFRHAVEIDPKGYQYHLSLGESFEQRGAYSKAREEYLSALELNSDSLEVKQRLKGIQQQAEPQTLGGHH
jgi:protein O-mannosyl-transferase